MSLPAVGLVSTLVHKGSIPARHKLERCPYNLDEWLLKKTGEGDPEGCRLNANVGRHLGLVDKNHKNPAAKGNYPSAPIHRSMYCGQWGHLVIVMNGERTS